MHVWAVWVQVRCTFCVRRNDEDGCFYLVGREGHEQCTTLHLGHTTFGWCGIVDAFYNVRCGHTFVDVGSVSTDVSAGFLWKQTAPYCALAALKIACKALAKVVLLETCIVGHAGLQGKHLPPP